MITVATPADRERIVETLVAAFRDDPELRYFFPDPADYAAGAATFFGHLFDKRVGRNTVWTVGGGSSVAIWEPPGTPHVPYPPLPDRVRIFDEAVEPMMPDEPYWYLGVLGTHPDHTGNRYGQAVMAEGLRRAAGDGLPAYLETCTESNVEMYTRRGWRVVGHTTEPMPIWVMRHG